MDNGLPGDRASNMPSAAMGTPSARGSLASGAGEGAEGWILGLYPPWQCLALPRGTEQRAPSVWEPVTCVCA